MKQIFKCSECGKEFEIEADHFVDGVSGRIVDSKGILHTFVDPTTDKLCDVCLAINLSPYVNGYFETVWDPGRERTHGFV